MFVSLNVEKFDTWKFRIQDSNIRTSNIHLRSGGGFKRSPLWSYSLGSLGSLGGISIVISVSLYSAHRARVLCCLPASFSACVTVYFLCVVVFALNIYASVLIRYSYYWRGGEVRPRLSYQRHNKRNSIIRYSKRIALLLVAYLLSCTPILYSYRYIQLALILSGYSLFIERYYQYCVISHWFLCPLCLLPDKCHCRILRDFSPPQFAQFQSGSCESMLASPTSVPGWFGSMLASSFPSLGQVSSQHAVKIHGGAHFQI